MNLDHVTRVEINEHRPDRNREITLFYASGLNESGRAQIAQPIQTQAGGLQSSSSHLLFDGSLTGVLPSYSYRCIQKMKGELWRICYEDDQR